MIFRPARRRSPILAGIAAAALAVPVIPAPLLRAQSVTRPHQAGAVACGGIRAGNPAPIPKIALAQPTPVAARRGVVHLGRVPATPAPPVVTPAPPSVPLPPRLFRPVRRGSPLISRSIAGPVVIAPPAFRVQTPVRRPIRRGSVRLGSIPLTTPPVVVVVTPPRPCALQAAHPSRSRSGSVRIVTGRPGVVGPTAGIMLARHVVSMPRRPGAVRLANTPAAATIPQVMPSRGLAVGRTRVRPLGRQATVLLGGSRAAAPGTPAPVPHATLVRPQRPRPTRGWSRLAVIRLVPPILPPRPTPFLVGLSVPLRGRPGRIRIGPGPTYIDPAAPDPRRSQWGRTGPDPYRSQWALQE